MNSDVIANYIKSQASAMGSIDECTVAIWLWKENHSTCLQTKLQYRI